MADKKAKMEHTFETVDLKVEETEFFLQKMAHPDAPGSFHFYLSAFLSASRTTTLALQHFKHLDGFETWYEPHRTRLKKSPLAGLFLNMRNAHVHGGPHPVTSSVHQGDRSAYFFHRATGAGKVSDQDVLSMSRDFFLSLLEIVYDCYVAFGTEIDPQQHYTKENYATSNLTIDDVEGRLYGWRRTELINEGFGEDDRWHELRANAGECLINHLFFAYLGKPTPQPLLPDYLADFEWEPEDRGWNHAPAGFKSVEEYQAYYAARRRAPDTP